MGSGGGSYSYAIEELVEKYKEEFRRSGYQIVHYDIQVNDFEAWLCEKLEKSREKEKKNG
jgi:hypothetical protein